jgi:hypothetical protein
MLLVELTLAVALAVAADEKLCSCRRISAARTFSVLTVRSLLFAVVEPVDDVLSVEPDWVVDVGGVDKVTFVPSG